MAEWWALPIFGGGSIVLLGLMTSLGALIRATHNPRLPLC